MNKEELRVLRRETLKKLSEMLDGMKDTFVRGYKFYDLGDPNNDEYTGILVEIRVNRVYHYYEMMLNYWKNQLNADEYYVTFKCNTMVICFKIRKL